MIKISANISKKVPLPSVEFSSQQFGASMEVEVSDADQPEAIHGRIRDLYALLSQSVDEQIAGAAQQPANGYQVPPANVVPVRSQPVQNVPPPVQQRPSYTNGNGRNRIAAATTNGNGRSTNATQAQQKAVWAICKSLGVEVSDALSEIGVGDLQTLSVKQASQLIDSLKARQNVR